MDGSTTSHAERRRECSAKSSHLAVRRPATSCDRRSDDRKAGARKRSSDEGVLLSAAQAGQVEGSYSNKDACQRFELDGCRFL